QALAHLTGPLGGGSLVLTVASTVRAPAPRRQEGTMANLSIRRGEQHEAPAQVWDPFRSIDPFQMIRSMLGADPFAGLVAPTGTLFEPDIEIKEAKDAFVMKVDVPGVREADLEVSMVGNRLTINGKREEEQRREDERFFVYERSYGTFSRSFVLPEGCD